MQNIRKLYYSIGEVASLVGEETHVLRFWESEFKELSPRRNSGRRRIYSQDDLEVVRQIHYLLKVRKYTLEGAKLAMIRARESNRPGGVNFELRRLKAFLENIRSQINVDQATGRSAAR